MPPPRAPFETAWRERFGEFAADSDDDAGIAGWSPSGLAARLRRFSGLWRIRSPGEYWLDAGCGAGSYARLLQQGGAEVIGVDYSPATIFKARARSPVGIAFVVADVRRLPFASGRFDGTLCLGVLQALAQPAPAIRELVSMTAPGGRIWVDALNRACIPNAWEILRRKVAGRPMHLRYDSASTLRRVMVAEGLTEVTLHWMPILPRRWHRLQRAFERPAATWIFARVPLVGRLLSHAFILRGTKPVSTAT